MATEALSPDRDSTPLTDGMPAGLFDDAPMPMLVADARTGRIMAANRALGTLLGRTPDELRGASLETIDTASQEEIAEYLLLATAAGDREPRRRTLKAWNAARIDVEVRAVPFGGTGHPAVVMTMRDARDDAVREQEQGRLRAQFWMAQKHETIGKLAAGLAHDFSNLLSVVMLTADALRARLDEDPEAQNELDVITDAGFRARELTLELLAFTGQQMMTPRSVSLNELVTGMEPLLRRAVPEDIELSVTLCEGQAAVHADPTQLQQVLLNLVVNAREAMPEGGRLVVSTQEVEVEEDFAREFASVQAGPHVLLSVSDTGVGMDEETRSRIFDPFFTTREQGRGSGLGLATVYGIVKQSDGSIWVTSQPGAGSNFRIYLPRLAGAPRRSVGPRGVRVGGVPGGDEHILLVEDDLAVRTRTAEILEELGYTVTMAATPDDAAMVHDDLWPERGRHPIDLILTDVIMPGMSGVELVRRIRTKREDVPVVFMSGYLDPMSDSAHRADSPYLAKPYTRRELARCIRATLDQDRDAGDGTGS
ncbi:MAG: ATP-binding protein [Longimicrobiales bacterium]